MRPVLIAALLGALVLPPRGMAGDQWRIARVWNDVARKSTVLPPEASSGSRAEIVPPGRLSLSVGCNDISARGLRPDGTALFESPAQTRLACPSKLMLLEGAVLAALNLVRSHERSGNEMILRDGEGREVLALVR